MAKRVSLTKEQLIDLYVNQRMSYPNIAKLLDIGTATVWRHLNLHNIPIRSHAEEMRGRTLAPEHRDKVVKTLKFGLKGEDNPGWKGGKSWRGRSKEAAYRVILVDGRYVAEHRYVAEQLIGRKLHRREHVHHKDGNKMNNSPDNLQVLTATEHAKLHMTDDHKAYLSRKSTEARAARFWSTKRQPPV